MKFKGSKLIFTRLEPQKNAKNATESKADESESDQASDELAKITLEADRYATTHLGAILFPLIVGFAIRTLIMDKHASWYSWMITTLTSCVYVIKSHPFT